MWQELRSFTKKPELSNNKLKKVILNNKKLFDFATIISIDLSTFGKSLILAIPLFYRDF